MKNANDRIQAAKKEREKRILKLCRANNKEGKGMGYFGFNSAWLNAIDRLEAKGKIKFKYPYTGKSGYWIVKKK